MVDYPAMKHDAHGHDGNRQGPSTNRGTGDRTAPPHARQLPAAPHIGPEHDHRRSLEALRWGIVAVTGGMFLTAAAVLGPRGSRATDPPQRVGGPDLQLPSPSADIARPNSTRRFLGELHGREYSVRIDLTPDGARYTVLKNGEVAGRDLSGEELASSFPDLDVAGMEAQPESGGALMLADPDDQH